MEGCDPLSPTACVVLRGLCFVIFKEVSRAMIDMDGDGTAVAIARRH